MSSSNIAVLVEGISKRYELYDKPSDQLRQYVLSRIRSIAKLPSRHYFREFWALSDISFEINKGEAFGIVGRNGSGKSTLLQIITGTLSPTIGRVAIQGRIGALLELGSGFNPEFSGRDNVFLNGALIGMSQQKVEESYDAIAGFADIGEFINQPVKSYSTGMVVRLAIAVQMQLKPDILIVDEALAVGDALFQKKCYRQIEKLMSDGCTLLFVSHDQETVRRLTGKAIFLNEGKVVASGPSTEVLFAYRRYLQEQDELTFNAGETARQQHALQDIQKSYEKSYGNCDVEIISVCVVNDRDQVASSISAGDFFGIRITCLCNKKIDRLNVAFRVRTREGIKVTTWGTLNEDMPGFIDGDRDDLFWSRSFEQGERFEVTFSGVCRLAANFYEVEAVVAQEYDRYYANQRILHWVDEAAHFTVELKSKEYVFDGICDMVLRSRRPEVAARREI